MSANGKPRKRPSSLMAQASALPSVENSLDEFIAKANETLLDPSAFNSAEVRREEDEKRKEADALRWKATEQQMRVVLTANDARLVDGPTAAGAYVLRVEDARRDEALQRLRQSGQIVLAEPIEPADPR